MRYRFEFVSNYVPLPDDNLLIKPEKPVNRAYKVKVYLPGKPYATTSTRGELALLSEQGYTHVVNFPGKNYEEIQCMCKFFNIVLLHYKNLKFVSDFCSRKTPPQNLLPRILRE